MFCGAVVMAFVYTGCLRVLLLVMTEQNTSGCTPPLSVSVRLQGRRKGRYAGVDRRRAGAQKQPGLSGAGCRLSVVQNEPSRAGNC